MIVIIRSSKTSLHDEKSCPYQSSVQTKPTAATGQGNWDI